MSASRALGRSEIAVTPVIFGAMDRARDTQTDAERLLVLEAAVDAGMTSIDTAPLYEFGRSEELVGRLTKGRRDQLQLLTKVGLRFDPDHDGHGKLHFAFQEDGRRREVRRDSRPASVRYEVEQSLRRLQVETLDLVQVHQPDLMTPIADTMGALAQLRTEGKLRAIGVSNFSSEQMLEAAEALGDVPLASNQVEYSALERHCEKSVLPAARARGIALLAYAPLAAGALSPRAHTALSPGDPRAATPTFHPENVRRLQQLFDQVLAPIAAAHAASPQQLCLAWLLGQPGVAGVLVGASSPEQARQNARAMALELSADELGAIRRGFERMGLDRWAGRGGRPAQALDLARRAARKARRLLS